MLKRFLFLITLGFVFGLAIMRVSIAQNTEPPFEIPEKSEILKLKSAVIKTSKGALYCELFPDLAPLHVLNFKYRGDKGLYKGLTFHLYEPNYIIQGGDPRGNGFGNPGYSLPPEFSPLRHTFGTIGMARMPDELGRDGRPVNPGRRSNGSQFHILLGDAKHMDGNYTIFGRVVSGFEVLKNLRRNDKIYDISVYVSKK